VSRDALNALLVIEGIYGGVFSFPVKGGRVNEILKEIQPCSYTVHPLCSRIVLLYTLLEQSQCINTYTIVKSGVITIVYVV